MVNTELGIFVVGRNDSFLYELVLLPNEVLDFTRDLYSFTLVNFLFLVFFILDLPSHFVPRVLL